MCQNTSKVGIGLLTFVHFNSFTFQSKLKEIYYFFHFIARETEAETLTAHRRIHGWQTAETGFESQPSGLIV